MNDDARNHEREDSRTYMGCIHVCICEHLFIIFLQCRTLYITSRLTSAIVLGNVNDDQTVYYNVTLSCIRVAIVAVEKR
jgi:hypothetical protein